MELLWQFGHMPRYYFHTEDGTSHPDEQGTELPGLDAARAMAIRTLGELLRDAPQTFQADMSLRLIVSDSDGSRLFELDVRSVEAPAVSPRGT